MSATLYYFNGRGRAEILRLMLAVAGIEYKEVYLEEKEDFDKLKADGKALFKEVPLLEVNGRIYSQTMAIVRYIARRGKLYGSTDDEADKIDECHEGAKDFQNAFLAIGFIDEKTVKESVETKTLPKYLPIFENLLKKNGNNGYLVGDRISFADIQLLEALLSTLDYFSENMLESHPALQHLRMAIDSVDKNSSMVTQTYFSDGKQNFLIGTFMRGQFAPGTPTASGLLPRC